MISIPASVSCEASYFDYAKRRLYSTVDKLVVNEKTGGTGLSFAIISCIKQFSLEVDSKILIQWYLAAYNQRLNSIRCYPLFWKGFDINFGEFRGFKL